MICRYPASTTWLAAVGTGMCMSVGIVPLDVGAELLSASGVMLWAIVRGRRRD